jgi:flavin reductase (DIM6/NTAB) family NADH-FMN oxidoreductase RutF
VAGVTIHTSDPFATPDDAKSSVRRLRGRLPTTVTLWTAYGASNRPAGLTVSSTLLVDGEPGRLVGIIDEESDLYQAAIETGAFAVCLLQQGDRRIADIFAGLMPAPGGPFGDDWITTEFGPVLAGPRSWAGCHLDTATPLGWGQLVTATVEAVRLGDEELPLIHYRGRYVDGLSGGPAMNG